MVRIMCVALIACAVALGAYAVITLYDETLQVGRIWETPAVKPHEQPIPVMANMSVPFTGGELLYRTAEPDGNKHPVSLEQLDGIGTKDEIGGRPDHREQQQPF